MAAQDEQVAYLIKFARELGADLTVVEPKYGGGDYALAADIVVRADLQIYAPDEPWDGDPLTIADIPAPEDIRDIVKSFRDAREAAQINANNPWHGKVHP